MALSFKANFVFPFRAPGGISFNLPQIGRSKPRAQEPDFFIFPNFAKAKPKNGAPGSTQASPGQLLQLVAHLPSNTQKAPRTPGRPGPINGSHRGRSQGWASGANKGLGPAGCFDFLSKNGSARCLFQNTVADVQAASGAIPILLRGQHGPRRAVNPRAFGKEFLIEDHTWCNVVVSEM